MKTQLVTASLNSVIPKNAPGEIVYIPVGTSNINATVSGKTASITVKVPAEKGEAIAATLQAALEQRLASPVRPRLAFDHERGGPASGHPKSFSFDPARGVILAVNWSSTGKSRIEGEDYGYFSPTFLVDDDGFPVGLPDKGEIGSLVDEPAFRSIGLIAAADADLTENKNEPTNMPKLIFAALSISEAHANAETLAVQAIDKLKTDHQAVSASLAEVTKENEALKKQVEAAETVSVNARKERADVLIKAALADGRLAPKDEDVIGKYRAKLEAGDTFAEEVLASLPPRHTKLTQPLVKVAASAPVTGTAFEVKAAALVTAGEAKTIDEAYASVAASDPSLYNDYLGTLAQ